jgi:hypothetical protein
VGVTHHNRAAKGAKGGRIDNDDDIADDGRRATVAHVMSFILSYTSDGLQKNIVSSPSAISHYRQSFYCSSFCMFLLEVTKQK